MDKINYNFIRVIISIVEHSNMSRAAEELEMLPGSISYAVNQLRKHFNDPLFIRDKNGVKPTSLAKQLYQHFKRAEESIELAFSLSPLQTEASNIKLHTIQLNELYLMKKLMDDNYFTGNNSLSFSAFTPSASKRLQQLRSWQIDLDIGLKLWEDPSIICIKLKDADFVYVAHKDSPIDLEAHARAVTHFKNAQVNARVAWSQSWTQAEESLRLYIKNQSERNKEIFYRTESLANIFLLMSISDIAYVMPRYIYNYCARFFPLKYADFPVFNVSRLSTYAHYHINNKNKCSINKIIEIFNREN